MNLTSYKEELTHCFEIFYIYYILYIRSKKQLFTAHIPTTLKLVSYVSNNICYKVLHISLTLDIPIPL